MANQPTTLVLMRYAPDAQSVGLIAGRAIRPGQTRTVTRAELNRAQQVSTNYQYVCGIDEEGNYVYDTEEQIAEPVTTAPPAFESPASMTVTDALDYAAMLDTDALAAFRDMEAERTKPRSSLLGPLDEMISRATESLEEENDERD